MSDAHRGDDASRGAGGPVRVFISYAHDDAEHEERVRDFWLFLRANGIDARPGSAGGRAAAGLGAVDDPGGPRRRPGRWWSPRRRTGGGPRGRRAGRGPGGAVGGPADPGACSTPTRTRGCSWFCRWCCPAARPLTSRCGWRRRPRRTTRSPDYTVAGAEALLRVLTGQPREIVPPAGRGAVPAAARRRAGRASRDARPVLRHRGGDRGGPVGDGQCWSRRCGWPGRCCASGRRRCRPR